MILESVITLFCSMLDGLLSAVSLVQIPTQGITALTNVVGYGAYVVGSDFLLVFCGCVCAWMTLKLTIGISLFLWRLLPLT